MSESLPETAQFRVTTRDGGELAVFTRGARNHPAVILVHGYPDDHGVWHPLTKHLERDFRVVTYDVRGSGQSFKPRRLRAYKLHRLADDLRTVIDTVSPDAPVHLVGHDWGSVQSWEAVTSPAFKPRILSFTAFSGPCLDHAGTGLRKRGAFPGQKLRSWYVGIFHIPLLAPLVWRLGLARAWPRVLHRMEGVQTHPQPTRAEDATRSIALYRANVLPRLFRPRRRHAQVPVQLIIPLRDRYVLPVFADSALPWLTDYRRVEVDAGHWINLSHPEWLAARIREFSAEHSGV